MRCVIDNNLVYPLDVHGKEKDNRELLLGNQLHENDRPSVLMASFLKSPSASIRRVNSTQMKALIQGKATEIRHSSFWRRQVHIRRIGKVKVWPLAALISFFFTFVTIRVVQNPRHPFTMGVERQMNRTIDAPFLEGCQDPTVAALKHPRENAAFVVLARNKEIEGVLKSMDSLEKHFNQWFNYPYVFLNNEAFNSTFTEKISAATNAKVEFGLVGPEAWGFPPWLNDLDEIKESIAQQGDRAIMYGGLETYHHMCRFFSGFFYNHPLLLKYDWYWRVEPDVTFFCDLTYDPFHYMAKHKKVYGFVIAIKELVETVPNMFRYASHWKRKNNVTSTGMWNMLLKPKAEEDSTILSSLPREIMRLDPIRDESPVGDPEQMEGESYNMCHFWSNFEIARLDFFQSPEYMSFFDAMDKTGGFWRERWGDAPIHSLGVGLLLETNQVHYFRDIGYQHTDIAHCPANAPEQLFRPKDKNGQQSRRRNWDSPKKGGSGCRCECPRDIPEVESKEGSCIDEWASTIGGWVD